MTENTKISVDFTFSFGAIEPKRKHRIESISREGRFRTRERERESDFFCNEIRYEIIWLYKTCQNKRKKTLPQASKVANTRFLKTVLFRLKNIYAVFILGVHCLKMEAVKNSDKEPLLDVTVVQIPFESSDNQHRFHVTTRVQLKVVSNRLFKCFRKSVT